MQKGMNVKDNRLFRYTTLPGLLHLLARRQLTLMPFESWEDKNDVLFLRKYAKECGRACYALCFTQADETFHHWKVYANGASGVRMTFDKNELLAWTEAIDGMRAANAKYRTIEQLDNDWPSRDEWPFIKRYAYQDEKELRLFYERDKNTRKLPAFDFDLKLIRHITLSPWLPSELRAAVIDVINATSAPTKISISKTGVTESDAWRQLLQRHA